MATVDNLKSIIEQYQQRGCLENSKKIVKLDDSL